MKPLDDRDGIPVPGGWALYFNGSLVFSAGEDKWETIGTAVAKIMEQEALPGVPMMELEQFARLMHALRREVALIFRDGSIPEEWDKAPQWQHEESVRSARKMLRDQQMTAIEEHRRWWDAKIADGWTYGPVRSDEKKIHPSMRPFEELPPGEQFKDLVRAAFAGAMTSYVRIPEDSSGSS